jgi:uncharacterized membrane protein
MWIFDRIPIYNFFEESGTLLSLIAVFFAVASFMAQLPGKIDNPILSSGILMILFLIGVLILILSYNIFVYAARLLYSKENCVFLQGIIIVIFAAFLYVIYGSLLWYFYSINPNSMIISLVFILLGVLFLAIFFLNMKISEIGKNWIKWIIRFVYFALSLFTVSISFGLLKNFIPIMVKPEIWNFFWSMVSFMLLCGIVLIQDTK